MDVTLYNRRKVLVAISGNLFGLYDDAIFGALTVFITSNYFNFENN